MGGHDIRSESERIELTEDLPRRSGSRNALSPDDHREQMGEFGFAVNMCFGEDGAHMRPHRGHGDTHCKGNGIVTRPACQIDGNAGFGFGQPQGFLQPVFYHWGGLARARNNEQGCRL